MKPLKICGRYELPQFVDGGFSHMISIGDPTDSFDGLRLPGIAEESHLILKFSDIHEADHPDAPSRENVAPLFSWLDRNSEIDGLLVHCAAGMGRSPAVALLVLCQLDPVSLPEIHTGTATAAAESSFLMPNRLVAEIGDDLLNRRGEIKSAVKVWRKAQGNPD